MTSASSFDLPLMISDFELYAKFGGEAEFNRLHERVKSFINSSSSPTSVIEDAIGTSVIRMCAIRLLTAITTGRNTHAAWTCLTFLCTSTACKAEPVVLTEIANYPDQLCDRLLDRMALVIADLTDTREVGDCLLFLAQFTLPLCNLQALSAHDALRAAFWRYVNGPFYQAKQHIQEPALTVAARLICQQSGEPTDHIWASLKDGALPIVVKAILSKSGNPQDTESCQDLLCNIFHAISELQPSERADMEEGTYKLGRNDIFRLTIATYNFFATAETAQQTLNAIRFTFPVVGHLAEYSTVDALRDFVLYKYSRVEGATAMVTLMRASALRSQSVLVEHEVERFLGGIMKLYSELKPDILHALSCVPRPTVPVRREKDRHCAYPDCPVDGQGLVIAMKKCGRFKSVYYCCRDHQTGHWPLHKKVCTQALCC